MRFVWKATAYGFVLAAVVGERHEVVGMEGSSAVKAVEMVPPKHGHGEDHTPTPSIFDLRAMTAATTTTTTPNPNLCTT